MGAFGTPASTVGAGLFGAPQTTHAAISTQPFGAATSTAFSQPGGAFGGGLFGAQQPATTVASGGLFGAPAPSQGFGASTTTTGLFGNTTAKPAGKLNIIALMLRSTYLSRQSVSIICVFL